MNDDQLRTVRFPHTLRDADPKALEVNRYYDRGLNLYCADFDPTVGPKGDPESLIRDLMGATIVAENYGFDVAMLLRKLGFEPWHYRKIELSSVALVVFGLDRPEGIAKTAARLRDLSYVIPEPDHSAAGDVACLRECYKALRHHQCTLTATPAAR